MFFAKDETKRCPSCGAEVPASYLKCHRCKFDFTLPRPQASGHRAPDGSHIVYVNTGPNSFQSCMQVLGVIGLIVLAGLLTLCSQI